MTGSSSSGRIQGSRLRLLWIVAADMTRRAVWTGGRGRIVLLRVIVVVMLHVGVSSLLWDCCGGRVVRLGARGTYTAACAR